MTTFKAVKSVLNINGISIHKICGEYKVYVKPAITGRVADAYFTTDLLDAMGTGLEMARNAGTLVGPDGTPVVAKTNDATAQAAKRYAMGVVGLWSANDLHQRLLWSERPAVRPQYSDSFWASPFKGLTIRAKANQYGNWYGYIGSTKAKYFFGDFIDQQFEAEAWVNLMVNASALATL